MPRSRMRIVHLACLDSEQALEAATAVLQDEYRTEDSRNKFPLPYGCSVTPPAPDYDQIDIEDLT